MNLAADDGWKYEREIGRLRSMVLVQAARLQEKEHFSSEELLRL